HSFPTRRSSDLNLTPFRSISCTPAAGRIPVALVILSALPPASLTQQGKKGDDHCPAEYAADQQLSLLVNHGNVLRAALGAQGRRCTPRHQLPGRQLPLGSQRPQGAQRTLEL